VRVREEGRVRVREVAAGRVRVREVVGCTERKARKVDVVLYHITFFTFYCVFFFFFFCNSSSERASGARLELIAEYSTS
jgi:hypothetical protein